MVEAQFSYADTHCHLDFRNFDHDRALVIERAREAGLKRILIPGIDLETSLAAIRLADEYPEIFAAIGIHPNSALSWNHASFQELEGLSRHPKVVAIGEIGLDYYRLGAPAEMQRRVFLEQLDLAGHSGLPVIIHNRNASEDIRKLLMGWLSTLSDTSGLVDRPGVLHSFSDDMETANWAVETNFFIGVTGPITYRSSVQLQHIIASLPLDRLIIETDAPFLPPHPHRGERNEPAHVVLIASKIAELRTIGMNVVVKGTFRNAARLFRWREID